MGYWDRLWVIGRRSAKHYLRLYPNPGLMVTIGPWQLKWSRFYGAASQRRRTSTMTTSGGKGNA